MSDQLARYTFLPWMRQGLASQLNKLDHLGKDADASNDSDAPTLNLKLNIRGEKKGKGSKGESKDIGISKTIQLYDPGDITGIEKRIIVKTEPRNNIQQFEPNLLPYVDFFEEDFLWRYTPLAANKNRLRPWLALVVLKEDEFEKEQIDPRAPLPSFKMKGKILDIPFPPAYQLWAWGHVHINKTLYDDPLQEFQKIVRSSPNLACSRLICPRKLEPETNYFAFVIPSFEKGRLAGLGAAEKIIDGTDIQLAAWGHEQKHFSGFTAYQKRFPVYHEWTFKTGKSGDDFETLARKIIPRALHPNVGKRLVDIQSPGYNLFFDGGEYPNQGAMLMEGALRHPDTKEEDLINDSTRENNTFTNNLADLLNLEENLKQSELPSNNRFTINPHFEDEEESIYDDPIITPPIYGKWHAKQDRVNPENKTQWVDQLNLDPRNRIAAGLGAEVVRKNQEQYMEQAWGQFEELFEANDFLKRRELMIEVNQRVIQKHFEPLPDTKFISVTAPIHKTVRKNRESIRARFKKSSIPNGVFSSGFDKVTRRGGRLVKSTHQFKPVDNNSIETESFSISTLNYNDTINNTASEVTGIFNNDTRLRALFFNAILSLNKSTFKGYKKKVISNNGLLGNENVDMFTVALNKLVTNVGYNENNYFYKINWEDTSPEITENLQKIKEEVIERTNPKDAFYRKIPKKYKDAIYKHTPPNEEPKIKAIINPPLINDPMYEEILKTSVDNFVPNLDLIPPNTSGLLEVNRKFLESYMVGLNYEMGRELLWREFPTDQRGTYFRMFWDSIDQNSRLVSDHRMRTDIKDIHLWDKELGSNPQEDFVTQPQTVDQQMVIVIRGDLLNRYPFTTVYLQKSKEGFLDGTPIHPIFEAKVEPDIFLIGFDKTKEEILKENGEGYFFVIQERPGEVHFGLDSEHQGFDPKLTKWDDFNWGHLTTNKEHIDINQKNDFPDSLTSNLEDDQVLYWGLGNEGNNNHPSLGEGSSSDMASILYQKSVKVAIHASILLPNE